MLRSTVAIERNKLNIISNDLLMKDFERSSGLQDCGTNRHNPFLLQSMRV